MRMAGKLKIHPDVFHSLEERGVDGVRASLYHAAAFDQAGFANPTNKQPLYAMRETEHGTVSVMRADAERWLDWKARRSEAWVKVSAAAAVVAAVLAALAWLDPLSGR